MIEAVVVSSPAAELEATPATLVSVSTRAPAHEPRVAVALAMTAHQFADDARRGKLA